MAKNNIIIKGGISCNIRNPSISAFIGTVGQISQNKPEFIEEIITESES